MASTGFLTRKREEGRAAGEEEMLVAAAQAGRSSGAWSSGRVDVVVTIGEP